LFFNSSSIYSNLKKKEHVDLLKKCPHSNEEMCFLHSCMHARENEI
jgi:hypothetical protein